MHPGNPYDEVFRAGDGDLATSAIATPFLINVKTLDPPIHALGVTD